MNILLEGRGLRSHHALELDAMVRILHAQGRISEQHLTEIELPLTGENPRIFLQLPECSMEASEIIDSIEARGIPFRVAVATRESAVIAISVLERNP